MITVNARDARSKLSELLTEAEHGEIISITRRGQEVARLVPPGNQETGKIPDLSEFRKSVRVKSGKIDSAELIRQMRDEERC